MTNEKAPERIWLSPASFTYKTSPAPTYIYSETESEPQDIEYARADLLATVRAEAFKEAAKAVRGLYHQSEVSDSRWNAAIVHAESAVEQLANRKGEG